MDQLLSTTTNWETLTHNLGKDFAQRAAQYDQDGVFVLENYNQLKEHRYFSAMIPEELGGSGMSYTEMCNLIRIIAHYCGSTALAFSMHQHLIASAIWKYTNKGEGTNMLQNVAKDQLVLVSTGGRDWLESNGEMKKADGGYLFSGKKSFASQSVIGDVVVTSAPYSNAQNQWSVLHFSVPMNSKGITILDDWNVLGMRATGSQSIVFDQVFVPASAIVLERPKGDFHPVWNVILSVAMPLINSL